MIFPFRPDGDSLSLASSRKSKQREDDPSLRVPCGGSRQKQFFQGAAGTRHLLSSNGSNILRLKTLKKSPLAALQMGNSSMTLRLNSIQFLQQKTLILSEHEKCSLRIRVLVLLFITERSNLSYHPPPHRGPFSSAVDKAISEVLRRPSVRRDLTLANR